MEHLIYPLIILLAIGVSIYLWNNEHRTVRQVIREKEEIETEEHRMFEFLHGLGEVLIEDSSPASMHRYITEGVAEVVGAKAGILYLVDNERDRLVPVAQTKKTAAVLPFPADQLKAEGEQTERKYRSLVRLSPLDFGQGLIGVILDRHSVLPIDDLAEFFDGDECSPHYHKGVALLGAPLVYANKKIGVIAVTRDGDPFNSNDKDVFASVAEQCSFALGSAIIHAEVNEKRRLEQELAQASEIQRILLPKKNPALSDFSLAATYRPARHVSGDYYDYVKVDRDHYGVAIADVCGKGIAASLIMAMCRSSLRSNAAENLSPAKVLHEVNASIFPDIREDMFVSFLYLILERDSDVISISNAGHEPPLVRRGKTGKVEENEVPGMAVGVDKGSVFSRIVKDHQILLEKGDIILLYTDGLIEAVNRNGEEYGFERFKQSFEDAKGDTAADVLESVLSEIEDFAEGTHATDDITLIAVEKR